MIETSRLVLRAWRDCDLSPFAALNADPEVMRHFPRQLDRDASDAFAARIRAHFDVHGFGMYAVSVKDGPDFIGFVGLAHIAFEAAFTPAVEIGWRLCRDSWGLGYASEAARACLSYGFGSLGLKEVVATAPKLNTASIGVMTRIGMTRTPEDDFLHPLLPDDSPLKPCVLYRAQSRSLNAS